MLEFEAVEAWFRRFKPLLDRFTSERNVMITKYLHNTPAWRFAFENPRGGQGAIDLWRIDERRCRINAVAWIDDEETDRRDLRTRASVEFEATEARIVEELNCALDELMSWDASDPSGWRSVDPPFHSTLRTGADRKRPRPVVQVLPTARPRKIR